MVYSNIAQNHYFDHFGITAILVCLVHMCTRNNKEIRQGVPIILGMNGVWYVHFLSFPIQVVLLRIQLLATKPSVQSDQGIIFLPCS
jgi:hypothetical protein